jgi:virginiamycin B lyase
MGRVIKAGILPLMVFVALLGSACQGATVTGMVKGPDGAPFPGAFVEARNMKMRMTVFVLSDAQGRYRIEKLPPGEYRVQINATGYRADPSTGMNFTSGQNASIDFALQPGVVHWNETHFYQAEQLWPPARGKDLIVQDCESCHQYQSRMASVTRDADGWRDRVAYMRTAMRFNLSFVTDKDAEDIASYLTMLFGPDSVLPKSPVEMPGYKATLRSFGGESLNIVYVEYDMPGPGRMPFSAAPDKNGYMWIPNFGVANKITRLDPKTGEMTDFAVPNIGTAGVHSAVPAEDGSVWLTEQGSNKLGRWDPETHEITEYQDPYLPGKEGIAAGGTKHTVRLDAAGRAWASGVPLSMYDPTTKKFTHFDEVSTSYDVKPDKNGDVWFTSPRYNKIGKVDGKTLKVTQWALPTADSSPRRLQIASDGFIYAGEILAGKLARFDPKNETMTEFALPGPDPTPYALGEDAEGYIWYNSHHMDNLGRLDPKTGTVIEYPFPHYETCGREFFRDSQGRMWYGTNPNNKVGYFYLAPKSGGMQSARK